MKWKIKSQLILLSLTVCLFGRIVVDVSLAATTKIVEIEVKQPVSVPVIVKIPENPPQRHLAPISSVLSEEQKAVKSYIQLAAEKKGINPELANCIVFHESQYDGSRLGDGGRARSYWQIRDDYHSEVSDEVAFSLEGSTDWSLDWIKQGHVGQWSTRNLYCSHYPVLLQ